MNYNDLLNTQYFDTMTAEFINSTGIDVVLYKLDKIQTPLNPIYNEEIGDSRVYLRGIELKTIYKTDPFAYSIDNGGIPSELDAPASGLKFTFSFNSLVQTIHGLKSYISFIKITPKPMAGGRAKWMIKKCRDTIVIRLIRDNNNNDLFNYTIDLNRYDTLSSLSEFLKGTGYFDVTYNSDDFTKAIYDFNDTLIQGTLVLKTMNPELHNVSDVINQGDLIWIPSTCSLWEVTSSYPGGNIGKYTTFIANASRTHSYIKYNEMRNYKYGVNINYHINDGSDDATYVPIDNNTYNIATDQQIYDIINGIDMGN